jgi:hypothetical protein
MPGPAFSLNRAVVHVGLTMDRDFTHEFPLADVERLIAAARAAAAFPRHSPEGWCKSPVDPNDVLAAFPALSLRPGYTLRAYSFREGGNGNAFVYATPVDDAFPEPEDCLRSAGHFLGRPVPPGALADVVDAIDGDRSAWSYLSASIFAREIREFGALWHGLDWTTHRILGSHPWKGPPASVPMTTDAERWTWIETAPELWLPAVTRAEPVTVRFYSYSGLGEQRVVRHRDTFRTGSYGFDTDEAVIARGPVGCIF